MEVKALAISRSLAGNFQGGNQLVGVEIQESRLKHSLSLTLETQNYVWSISNTAQFDVKWATVASEMK